nr:MAG TPA: hypothetical protein [Caudoviricetes sp.]
MTNTDRILEEKLRRLFNDDDFVLGVFTFMNDQSARQELINYIDNNKNATSEEIGLIALDYGLNNQGEI